MYLGINHIIVINTSTTMHERKREENSFDEQGLPLLPFCVRKLRIHLFFVLTASLCQFYKLHMDFTLYDLTK